MDEMGRSPIPETRPKTNLATKCDRQSFCRGHRQGQRRSRTRNSPKEARIQSEPRRSPETLPRAGPKTAVARLSVARRFDIDWLKKSVLGHHQGLAESRQLTAASQKTSPMPPVIMLLFQLY